MVTLRRTLRECKDSEQGFLSILGCCILFAVLFCGMILSYLAKNEMESLNRYQAEIQLHYAAKSCMEQAAVLLENQHIAEAAEKYQKTTCVLDTQFSDKIHVVVHAKEKSGAIILMSRADQQEFWGVPAYQAVYGYMTKEGDYYVWTGWFEQNS